MSPRLGNKWKFNPNIQGFPQTVGSSFGFTSYLLTDNFFTYFWPISSPAVLDLLIHRRQPTQFGCGAEPCLIPFSGGKSDSTANPLTVQKKKKKKLPLRSRTHPNSSLETQWANLRNSQTLCGESTHGMLRVWANKDNWQKMKITSRLGAWDLCPSKLSKEEEEEWRRAGAKQKNQTVPSGRPGWVLTWPRSSYVKVVAGRKAGFLLMWGNYATLHEVATSNVSSNDVL